MEEKLIELIKRAEDDKEVKVILLHGGNFFSSGNDLSMFVNVTDPQESMKKAKHGVKKVMVDMLMAI